MILFTVVLSQYTRVTDRETDDRQHLMTIVELCNILLKMFAYARKPVNLNWTVDRRTFC